MDPLYRRTCTCKQILVKCGAAEIYLKRLQPSCWETPWGRGDCLGCVSHRWGAVPLCSPHLLPPWGCMTLALTWLQQRNQSILTYLKNPVKTRRCISRALPSDYVWNKCEKISRLVVLDGGPRWACVGQLLQLLVSFSYFDQSIKCRPRASVYYPNLAWTLGMIYPVFKRKYTKNSEVASYDKQQFICVLQHLQLLKDVCCGHMQAWCHIGYQ